MKMITGIQLLLKYTKRMKSCYCTNHGFRELIE